MGQGYPRYWVYKEQQNTFKVNRAPNHGFWKVYPASWALESTLLGLKIQLWCLPHVENGNIKELHKDLVRIKCDTVWKVLSLVPNTANAKYFS
jgi:hypothetical protein